MHPSTLQVREGMASSAELESWLQVAETFAGEAHTICEIGLNGGDSAAAATLRIPSCVVRFVRLGSVQCDHRRCRLLVSGLSRPFHLDSRPTLATLPQYARAHPRSCDIMIVDGGHSLEVGYGDLSYMRMLASDPSRHIVVMDDVRCAASWCKAPTDAWSYLVQEGVVREEGCLVDSCCSGWCWGRYDLTALSPTRVASAAPQASRAIAIRQGSCGDSCRVAVRAPAANFQTRAASILPNRQR